jgi:hypothetical protein
MIGKKNIEHPTFNTEHRMWMSLRSSDEGITGLPNISLKNEMKGLIEQNNDKMPAAGIPHSTLEVGSWKLNVRFSFFVLALLRNWSFLDNRVLFLSIENSGD